MKPLSFLLIFMWILSSHAQEDFQKYRWEKRLVVLVSKNFDDAIPKLQLSLFEKEKEALAERDMLILKSSPKSEELKTFKVSNNFEGVLLIGKDGGVKARYPFTVEPRVLFELVDGMPMRKSEMRRKKGGY